MPITVKIYTIVPILQSFTSQVKGYSKPKCYLSCAGWCHARSRVAGGLRRHDMRQVQRQEDLFWFGGDKMDLRRTFDGATWPCGGSSHVGCCWGSVGWFSATGGWLRLKCGTVVLGTTTKVGAAIVDGFVLWFDEWGFGGLLMVGSRWVRDSGAGQELAITEWEDMKTKLQDEYLPQYFRAKYLPQSSCGHSQDRKDNLRHRNSQPIAQFEENKVSVHSVSSPTLSPIWWSRLEQHLENLRKIIQDEIKASQKEINNSEVSHTRDISVEPPILSATIKIQDLQVQEEELIVEPKQQVFEDTQLDEVDKVVSFSSLIPHIEFIIPWQV
uniref:Retrotransposon gag domain-containing protein n=1 Tax=Fagus sylvatica TaxID=28930 RepID=A0A2N9GEI0_FAGSY